MSAQILGTTVRVNAHWMSLNHKLEELDSAPNTKLESQSLTLHLHCCEWMQIRDGSRLRSANFPMIIDRFSFVVEVKWYIYATFSKEVSDFWYLRDLLPPIIYHFSTHCPHVCLTQYYNVLCCTHWNFTHLCIYLVHEMLRMIKDDKKWNGYICHCHNEPELFLAQNAQSLNVVSFKSRFISKYPISSPRAAFIQSLESWESVPHNT